MESRREFLIFGQCITKLTFDALARPAQDVYYALISDAGYLLAVIDARTAHASRMCPALNRELQKMIPKQIAVRESIEIRR